LKLLIFSEFSVGKFLEGTNLITLTMAKYLVERGHQVVILTPPWIQDRERKEGYFRKDGVEIFKFAFPRVANPVARILYYFLNGLRLHRRYRFDLVLGLYTLPPYFSAVLLGSVAKMKKAGALWEPIACERVKKSRLFPPLLRQADGILTMTDGVKERIVETLSIAPDKVTVIPGFSDLTLFSPGPKSPDLVETYSLKDRFVLLFVGRISSLKGVPDLIRAVEGLTDVKLLMVGREVAHENVRDLIKRLGLETRVHLLGYRQHGSLPDLYRVCDAFVLPSLNEGFGLVVAEAMACGKPVIVSDAPPLPEVAGEGGIVFKRGDVKGLREAILRLKEDEGFRRTLGNRALERSKRFDQERVMEEYLQLFEALASGS
jgi:glycosyltransferase involved in cell wall biosynthesis